jgi:hypothetical protein
MPCVGLNRLKSSCAQLYLQMCGILPITNQLSTGKGYMLTGDYLKVTTQWEVPNASNPCENVWYFECESVSNPTSLAVGGDVIVDAFIARYVTPLMAYTNNDVHLRQVDLRSLTDLTDGYTAAGDLAVGEVAGVLLPPFVTYSVRLVRYNLSTNNGRKAFVGAPVGAVSPGGVLSDGYRNGINTIMNAWSTTDFVVEGPDYAFTERIVRLSGTPGTLPTRSNYIRDYVLTGFGTQNTRKA